MKKIVITLLIALLLNGCAKDNHPGFQNQENGKLVSVKLNFKVPPADAPVLKKMPETKSREKERFSVELIDNQSTINGTTKSAGTTVLNNLWVFQFNSSGAKMTSSKLPDTPIPIKDMLTIDVQLKVGTDQTIYLVALGSKLDNDLSWITNFSELENYNLDYIQFKNGSYTSKITSDAEMPYAGCVKGVDIVQLEDEEHGLVQYNPVNGFVGGIEMRALLAKISLHYTYNVEGYTFMGIDLKSVASIATVNPLKAKNTQYCDLKATTDISEKDAQNRYVYSWYIARNMQGTKETITTESDRYKRNAPTNATNFAVWANQMNTADTYTAYSIYIGANNTSNFDIDAGFHYILRTDIDMADADDNRVETSVVTQKIDFIAGNNEAEFDCHYNSRPLIVTASRRKIKVEIVNFQDETPADENSWLKVSLDNNYTAAYNNNSLKNSAEVDVIVPGKFKFYLYCDEYVEVGAKSRILRVKVTTKESIGDGKSEFYNISQKPITTFGYWGGHFDKETGEYRDLLGFENFSEVTQKINEEDPPLGEGFSYGYYNYNVLLNSQYESMNLISGYEATRVLAENPDNIIINQNSNPPFEQTRKINGVIDLYQYTRYSNYAARYCYDKNRDLNGNGKIDDDEFKWYLPSMNQIMAYYLSGENGFNLSSTEKSNSEAWAINLYTGATYGRRKTNIDRYYYCVRDVKQIEGKTK